LQGDSRASADQMRELIETIEDVTFDKINQQLEQCTIAASEYRQEIEKLMS
jgi:hypothetical protein